ncbi:MAG: hypothetical protein L3K09_03730 [Thermoplasmata archaeon]|nr:hypothetical protein [Thermoplasmata archaeon]
MKNPWTAENGPWWLAGLLLLVVASLLLFGGGSLYAGAPRAFDLLLLAAAAILLVASLLRSAASTPDPARSSAVSVAETAAPTPPAAGTSAPSRSLPVWDESELSEDIGDSLAAIPVAPVASPLNRPRERSPASIPTAWAFASEDVEAFPASWPPIAPPSGAALPFYPAVAQAPFVALGLDPRGEIDRLRARVRELESPSMEHTRSSGTDIPDTPFPLVSRSRPIPEPPALRSPRVGGDSGCAGCGTLLSEKISKPLCWGCGRALCASCFWHFGPGPGLHRCPACYGQSGPATSASRSGGRAGLPPVIGTGATASGGPAAVAPTAQR